MSSHPLSYGQREKKKTSLLFLQQWQRLWHFNILQDWSTKDAPFQDCAAPQPLQTNTENKGRSWEEKKSWKNNHLVIIDNGKLNERCSRKTHQFHLASILNNQHDLLPACCKAGPALPAWEICVMGCYDVSSNNKLRTSTPSKSLTESSRFN